MSYDPYDLKCFVAREAMKAERPIDWFWTLELAVQELGREFSYAHALAVFYRYLPTGYDWPPTGGGRG